MPGSLTSSKGEVEFALGEALDGRLAGKRHLDLVTAQLEQIGDALGMVAVVIDDEDRVFGVVLSAHPRTIENCG